MAWKDEIEWETKDGKPIPIPDLLDEHIKNILRMFNNRRVDSNRAEMLEAVIIEAEERGIDIPCIFEVVDDEDWGNFYNMDFDR